MALDIMPVDAWVTIEVENVHFNNRSTISSYDIQGVLEHDGHVVIRARFVGQRSKK
jgi:hypothetical protein